MRIHEVRRVLILLFIFSWFAGILYVNMYAKKYIVSTTIFDDYFMKHYSAASINSKEYIWYIVKKRLYSISLLWIISSTKHRKWLSVIWLVWIGFLCGIIMTTAVFQLKIKGIILCIVGILPHYIAYITAYTIIFLYIFSYPDYRWNPTKTVSIILFVLLGMITECYVNPVLMEIFISKF